MKSHTKTKKPFVLLILDGWGIAKAGPGNAVALAKTPVMNRLWKKYPHTFLTAHGLKVGLPQNQDGNSEAGHMNLGAGRVTEQDAVRISKSINEGTFFKNPVLIKAIQHVKKNKSNLHIMGLLSNGQSAHSDPDHLYALLSFVKNAKVKKIFLHLFTDGRDSPRFAALRLLDRLTPVLDGKFDDKVKIASIIGRFYAMDRKKIWSRTELAYNAMVAGEGLAVNSPREAILQAYNRNESDEFIIPSVILKNRKPVARIANKDAIVFFNLRSDRARQLSKPFVQPNFESLGGFKRKKILKDIYFVALTDFGPDLPDIHCAYTSPDLHATLPMILKDYRQLYVAESEKYAHVTYFFNGGYADPVAGEQRMRIDSPDVASYAEKPEMSAYSITGVAKENIKHNIYDFVTVNFANPDMVGHTGDLKAGIRAVEVVDECVGEVVAEVLAQKGTVIVTADHGNVEEMINLETGEVSTEHTTYPVPFIIAGRSKIKKVKKGVLGDVAPTILKLMKIKKPKEMSGKSLI